MQFKSLMVVAVLGLTGLTAHADGSLGEFTPSVTFSSMLDKSFITEQARFFLPSAMVTDEGRAKAGVGSAKSAQKQAHDQDAVTVEATDLEALAMLMAGLGVVGFVAGRRKSG